MAMWGRNVECAQDRSEFGTLVGLAGAGEGLGNISERGC